MPELLIAIAADVLAAALAALAIAAIRRVVAALAPAAAV